MSPAPSSRRRQLESTVAAIQQKHGVQALRPARELIPPLPPAASTGFPALDAITGCQGVPLGHLTLFSGPGTSGKLTIAYKTLAHAQGEGATAAAAALLDLTHTVDPDYLQRCGVSLERLLIVRPQEPEQNLPLLLDLVYSRQVRLVLVDGLPEMTATRALGRAFNGSLGRLRQVARAAGCGVLFVDEVEAPWQRWLQRDASGPVRQNVALHVELRRERWLRRDGVLVGYSARAQVRRSRWRSDNPTAPVEIVFNGSVHARTTW